ncbi:emerin-like isoform X2 [Corythoichthys intestinalis]|uniref:emerin-like isoform X2 n=1 Tax=Corythoichthys intestinalis TaxID=161448 RepID=UPI0025A50037|nr:emerin-like isoform X2 [Corythoichthys intestinalis]
MSALSAMSADKISDLLDEYGIKHGPVVESTRRLYEKKIREAMAKGEMVSLTNPDKTYYREEEEEVTYVYSTPARSDLPKENRPYMRARPEWTEREVQHKHYSYGTGATPVKWQQDVPKAPQSSLSIPVWVQLVFFVVAVIFLYFVFSNMETNDYTRSIE